MSIARKLYTCGVGIGFTFDIHEDTLKTIKLLDARSRTAFRDFGELYTLAERLNDVVRSDGLASVLCHNGFYPPSFLIADGKIDLTDWEYSSISDYAGDLAVLICCSDYSYEKAMHVLEVYFERPLTKRVLLPCVASICVVSFHWFMRALYQDMRGSPVGERLFMYYKCTKFHGAKALDLIAEKQRIPCGCGDDLVLFG